MEKEMTAVGVLCEATIRAAGCIAREKGIDFKALDPGYNKLSAAMRETVNLHLDGILVEWKAAAESLLPESMIRHMLNVQANWLAVKALQSLGWIEGGAR